MTDIVANRRAFLKGLAIAPVAAVVPAIPAPAYAAVGEVGPALPTGRYLSFREANKLAQLRRDIMNGVMSSNEVRRAEGFLSIDEARAIEALPPMVRA